MTAGDSMALLEAQAQQLAEGSKKETKAGGISFVRYVSITLVKSLFCCYIDISFPEVTV